MLILSTIIRDESQNIDNLITSYSRIVSKIILVDTGSTNEEWNKTIEIIKKHSNIEIIVDKFKWIDDFSDARNYSLNIAHTNSENKDDIIIFADADDILDIKFDKISFSSDSDLYQINKIEDNEPIEFLWGIRSEVVNKYKWKCPVHEIITPIKGNYGKIQHIDEINIIGQRNGYRSKHDETYYKDLIIIEKYLVDNFDDQRMQYHRLQTLKDIGLKTTLKEEGYKILNLIENNNYYGPRCILLLIESLNDSKITEELCRRAFKLNYLYVDFYYHLSLSLLNQGDLMLANAIINHYDISKNELSKFNNNIINHIKDVKDEIKKLSKENALIKK